MACREIPNFISRQASLMLSKQSTLWGIGNVVREKFSKDWIGDKGGHRLPEPHHQGPAAAPEGVVGGVQGPGRQAHTI